MWLLSPLMILATTWNPPISSDTLQIHTAEWQQISLMWPGTHGKTVTPGIYINLLSFCCHSVVILLSLRCHSTVCICSVQNWLLLGRSTLGCLFSLRWNHWRSTVYLNVASSRPVYSSILECFGQRAQYISNKYQLFLLHKHSENAWLCY